MKVLITGANGYIGRHLLGLLPEERWDLAVLVRKRDSGAAPAWHQQASVHYGALPDSEVSAAACKGADVIIHLAGLAHVSASESALKTSNLDATLQLATIARQQGVKKFIFISSSKARFAAHSAYGRIKAETEQRLLELHDPATFQVIILRPALVYGRGMQGNLAGLLRLLARRTLPVFISSDRLIGMIGVRDLCGAIIQAVKGANLGGAIWELADGQTYTLDAIVRHVRALHGYRMPMLVLPRPLVKAVALLSTIISPVHKSSFSMSTYKTLFDENYCHDPQFWQRTASSPHENFYQALPALLEGENA